MPLVAGLVWTLTPAFRPSAATLTSEPLRFSYWGGVDDHRMWSEIVDGFHASQPGLRVRGEWLPLSGYSVKLSQQFIGRTAPDIILFQDEPLPRYAREFVELTRWVQTDPIVQAICDDFQPGAREALQVESQLRGVPVMGGVTLIYCNLAAFRRAADFHGRPILKPGPMWTLDEFVLLCRDLTLDLNGDGRTDQYGFFQPHWVYYLPFAWSCGASLTDESGSTWALAGAPAERAFALYADLRHRWIVTPSPGDYAGQNSDTAFLSGRVAMCVNGPWFQTFLAGTALEGDYAVAPIPAGPGGSASRATWDGLCIYRGCEGERAAGARRFLAYALGEAAQTVVARHQRAIPVRRSCGAAFVEFGGGAGSPADVFLNELARARMQRATPDWVEMSRCVSRHLTSVLLEGDARRSPSEAISALARERVIRERFSGARDSSTREKP
ncbi:Bacterial extracellular solute-binding protein [Phycisphaerae bacterium RAS2]|nr:Bacterial extracellular solute-binding protein [Phycisphaerae bacterium RAS2]